MKKVFVLAVLSLLAILLTPGNALAIISPQPLTPADGALVEVNPINGVTLTISAPEGVPRPVWVEASQNPATTGEGQFADPLASHAQGLPTHDPNVLIAYISRTEFPNPTDPFITTTFTGETGRVYWRPHVIECEEEPAGSLNTICFHYGAIRSFLYDVRLPAPTSEGDRRGKFLSYVGCGLARNTHPAHRCSTKSKKGAFFESRDGVIYTVCIRLPGGRRLCAREQLAERRTLYVNRFTANRPGRYQATWFVEATVVGRYAFRIVGVHRR